MSYLRILFSALAVSLIFAGLLCGQDEPQTRSATSLAFKSKRPAGTRPRPSTSRPDYRFIRRERGYAAKPSSSVGPKAPTSSRPVKTETTSPLVPQSSVDIGLTMWRLRPPAKDETGVLFTVDHNDTDARWLAERISTDTALKVGDKVRFGIESSIDGYLYLFNRETFADGTVGRAYRMFPEKDDDDNLVGPGLLFDMPDQRDEYPYFNVKNKGSKSNYNGELLIVILSPRPLARIAVDQDGFVTDARALEAFEDASVSDVFEMTERTDKVMTQVEAESACGPVTRGFERAKKKPGDGCSRAKKLTQADPGPQTLLRIYAPPGKPFVAYVRLAAAP